MSAPQPEDDTHKVLPFRRRQRPRPQEKGLVEGSVEGLGSAEGLGSVEGLGPVEGLGKFAEPREPDDYRQRMINNALALAFCVLLVGIGVWLANTMADLRRNQDCVLSGRRDCGKIPQTTGPK